MRAIENNILLSRLPLSEQASPDEMIISKAELEEAFNEYPEISFWKRPGKKIIERMEKELKMIDKLDFCSYFLINQNIVNYARSKGFPYVGRGSGANSMVAYLLQITNIDPT